MAKLLFEIATAFTGYSFRQPNLVKSAGRIAVIQMRDIAEGQIRTKSVEGFTDIDNIGDYQFLQPGDLLLTARGMRTTATAFEPTDIKTIASAAFLVIRPDATVVDSAYLHWYLNGVEAQNWFETGKEQGTTVRALPIQVVQSLSVPLPPSTQQRAMGNVARLSAREQDIVVQIAQSQRAKRDRELGDLINQ